MHYAIVSYNMQDIPTTMRIGITIFSVH